MKRTPCIAIAVLLLVPCVQTVAQRNLRTPPPFAARVDSVVRAFESGGAGDDFYTAAAMVRSPDGRTDGLRLFESLLRDRATDATTRFRLTAAYLLCATHIPDTLTALVRATWEDIPVVPLRAEHEEVTYYSALLLACDRLPGAARWWNGRSTEENRTDATEFLLEWMRITTEEGQQEFDSPTYGPHFIAAMLLLREYATDAGMRTAAELMTTWLLADYMHETIAGQMAGAHARVNLQAAMQPVASDMNALAWLYFGHALQVYAREQYVAAVCSYVPPAQLAALSELKKDPFEAIEWKRSATRIRGDSVATRPVRKYTFIDRYYAVGSIPGGMVQPDEQHSWDVTYVANSPSTTLFTMQPYGEAAALGEFHPHSPDLSLRTVTRINPYYSTTTKTAGGSPYEHVFQHRSTVIALYDIPAIQRFPLMVGFLPSQVKSFELDSIKTRWITFNTGEVYLAVLPLKQSTVRPEQNGYRLFSPGGRNGAVVQIARRSEFKSYRDFVRKVKATSVDTSEFETRGVIRYKSVSGDRLECSIGGSLRVNGREQRFDPGKLFDSPSIRCERGTGVMTISDGKSSLVIDMRARKQSVR